MIVQGDSDIAQGLGSMGSRSLYIGGSAMLTASKDTIEKGKQLAAEALEVAGPDVNYRDGRFTVTGTDLGIGLFELAGKQPERRIAIKTTQQVGGPSWPNSCHVCEVEIDPETGVTEIVRYTTVDDVGRVVNPLIVAGQVHGGIAQAVGQALLEDARYDPESGQLVTGSFLDYCMPRADNLPSIATFTDESSPCKINPLGAKGVGELGTVGGTPTVINAVIDALRPLGVKHIEMPATSRAGVAGDPRRQGGLASGPRYLRPALNALRQSCASVTAFLGGKTGVLGDPGRNRRRWGWLPSSPERRKSPRRKKTARDPASLPCPAG